MNSEERKDIPVHTSACSVSQGFSTNKKKIKKNPTTCCQFQNICCRIAQTKHAPHPHQFPQLGLEQNLHGNQQGGAVLPPKSVFTELVRPGLGLCGFAVASLTDLPCSLADVYTAALSEITHSTFRLCVPSPQLLQK